MRVFVILGFDSVRIGSNYHDKLVGIRVSKTREDAETIGNSEWGQQFTFCEIEERELCE